MKIPKANKIAEVRKQRQLTQQQLADKVGVHWMTISKLERGRMQLTQDWIEKIALALGVPLARLVSWDPLVREIMTKGVITEGFVVEEEEHAESKKFEDDETFTPTATWYFVDGDDLRPFFFHGDALCFQSMFEADFKHLTGRLAQVLYLAGDENYSNVFAVVGKHLGDNRFNLHTLKGMRIDDVEVWSISILRGFLARSPIEGEAPDTPPRVKLPNTA